MSTLQESLGKVLDVEREKNNAIREEEKRKSQMPVRSAHHRRQTAAQILDLVKKGSTVTEAAAKVGCSTGAAASWVREHFPKEAEEFMPKRSYQKRASGNGAAFGPDPVVPLSVVMECVAAVISSANDQGAIERTILKRLIVEAQKRGA